MCVVCVFVRVCVRDLSRVNIERTDELKFFISLTL